jgi:hypothetical protein
MRQFVLAALAAVPTFAQWQWSTLDITEDGRAKPTYVRTTPTSVFEVVGGDRIDIEADKAVFMQGENKAEDASHYKPALVGGSI